MRYNLLIWVKPTLFIWCFLFLLGDVIVGEAKTRDLTQQVLNSGIFSREPTVLQQLNCSHKSFRHAVKANSIGRLVQQLSCKYIEDSIFQGFGIFTKACPDGLKPTEVICDSNFLFFFFALWCIYLFIQKVAPCFLWEILAIIVAPVSHTILSPTLEMFKLSHMLRWHQSIFVIYSFHLSCSKNGLFSSALKLQSFDSEDEVYLLWFNPGGS